MLLLLAVLIPSGQSLFFGTLGTQLGRALGLMATPSGGYPLLAGEEVMKQKAHGTCENPVQKNLRWNCDWDTADRICCFNRHYGKSHLKNSSLSLTLVPRKNPIVLSISYLTPIC
jgi:hypothetical protein